jgi:hypothetical protein
MTDAATRTWTSADGLIPRMVRLDIPGVGHAPTLE